MKLNYLLNNIKDQLLSISSSTTQKNDAELLILRDNRPNKLLDIDINGLSLNSKLVKKRYLFFCLSGSRYRGSDFIKEAYANGASVVMTEEEIKSKLHKNLIIVRVKDIIKCLGCIANKFYGYPQDRLNLTAVTGTNGKTTTVFILENILKAFKKDTGVIGTVNYRFGENVFSAKNTTPDILTTHSLIDKMIKNRTQYLLMEVSSHALAQRRIEGLKFDQAIFTNLSQDHFDYHKTKEEYFMAKLMLFRNHLKENGIAVINIDDNYGLRLIDLIKTNKNNRILTYGIKRKSGIYANKILFNNAGCCFTVHGLKHKFKVETNLVGIFNIYNALASISVCLALDVPEKHIIKGLKEIYVPGRLEAIRCNHNIRIFVDYAHTEDALRNILLSLKRLKGAGRLIVVFGCGGDRDRDKRPKMGKVASQLADFVIITSDNPRSEDPEKIISDIKVGTRKTNCLSFIDRKDAIKKAIDIARCQDIIIVAGKGHENYQVIKDKKLKFDDRLVIENILSKK